MEGCSNTEKSKSQKVGCLQARFRLVAAFGPRDFKSPVPNDRMPSNAADLLEAFADTFLLAAIYKAKEFGDPFPEISENTKECCYSYIYNILSTN